MKNRTISVKGSEVTVATRHEQNCLSPSDMVRNLDGGGSLIEQWLRTKDTGPFWGVWEQLNNPGFNSVEFDGIEYGARRFHPVGMSNSTLKTIGGNFGGN